MTDHALLGWTAGGLVLSGLLSLGYSTQSPATEQEFLRFMEWRRFGYGALAAGGGLWTAWALRKRR